MHYFQIIKVEKEKWLHSRGVFRTQSNICNGGFQQKKLAAESGFDRVQNTPLHRQYSLCTSQKILFTLITFGSVSRSKYVDDKSLFQFIFQFKIHNKPLHRQYSLCTSQKILFALITFGSVSRSKYVDNKSLFQFIFQFQFLILFQSVDFIK